DPHELSLSQLARMALDRGGGGGVWTPIAPRTMGYQATADFTGLLDGVAHAVFLDAFDAAVRTFEPWCTAITVNDFRSTYALQATFPAFDEIPEHAESTYAGPVGPEQPMRLAVYGKILAFTRQAFLRDDAPGLAQLTAALANAASAAESDAVYAL